MKLLHVLVCLGLSCAAAAENLLNPRGARPVEPATRSEKCASQKEWPFCTDDDWGYKCPSGCRIQGLMDKNDHRLLKKIEKIRGILDQNKAQHHSANQVSKQTYDYLKEKLIVDGGQDDSYYNLAQSLRQRITDMKVKIDRQLRILAALKERVKDQVVEAQRLEVDIDIKLRSCKGSCKSYAEYQVDTESYEGLDKQINQLESKSGQTIQSVGTLYVMKSRPLTEAVLGSVYKSGSSGASASLKEDDIFSSVKNVQLILEEEGSPTSPATISKDTGTSYSSSKSSSSSSSSTSSITELGGPGDAGLFGGGSPSSKSISCTKTIKRTTVMSKTGPVEKVEEVFEGGPECQVMSDNTKGGMSVLFPSLGTSSSSSSSSSSVNTQAFHTSGTKGSLTGGTKDGFGIDPFDDLGAFLTAAADDDVPDLHARSVKSTRVERQAGYVGKDCVEAHQKHLTGETNGLFKIRPGGGDSAALVEVYCQQEGLMGGWLLVQQRESGALGFNRTWAEYRGGFGSVDAQGKGEFWLGNQNLHLLTSRGETMLKVELEDWEGGAAGAEYIIRVGSEAEGYPLHVSGYTGDAGDALLTPSSDAASNLFHGGMKFSTFDRDNDTGEGNCAATYGGGWWYNNCQSANLNGIYYRGLNALDADTKKMENGVVWVTYKPSDYSLKSVRMFIRPLAF